MNVDKFMNNVRNVALIIAIIIAAFATQTAVTASQEAQQVNHQLRVVEYQRALAEYERALGTCASSTALRSLLHDLKEIAFPLALDSTVTPEVQARLARLRTRIDEFTATNPNCKNVPSKPVKEPA